MLGLPRSTWYDRVAEPSALNLELMRRLDEEYTAHPFYGSRRMTEVLRRAGYAVNRKRVIRLMGQMGLAAIYPKPRTTVVDTGHRSMDGRGRALDNVFVERLWRTVKYEHPYLHDYATVPQLEMV